MSTDSNEKSQSTFPRSSLRARNRTIVMAPADIDDFRPEPRKTKTPIKLEEIFDESLLASHDTPVVEEQEREPKHAEPKQSLPEVDDSKEKASEAPASFGSGALDALGEDEFEGERKPITVSSGDNRENLIPSDSHEPLLQEFDAREAVQSVAPVARIVRSAEVETRRIEPAPVIGRARDLPQSQPAAQESFEHEHTVDVEEDMERLLEQENVAEGEREHLEMRRPSKLVGFLVSFELDRYGRYIELREGRLLVSCEGCSSDNCLVIDDPSVSPMHAIMRISSNGTIMILDQLSEHGTRIKRCGSDKEEALLGDKGTLEHGDVVIFGECGYHVCILKGI